MRKAHFVLAPGTRPFSRAPVTQMPSWRPRHPQDSCPARCPRRCSRTAVWDGVPDALLWGRALQGHLTLFGRCNISLGAEDKVGRLGTRKVCGSALYQMVCCDVTA